MRVHITSATQKGWLLYQLGVKSTFWNGELREEVYVEPNSRISCQRRRKQSLQSKKRLVRLVATILKKGYHKIKS